ncbi:MAG: T9SS type A sorting domain-containing protein [Flavobacteriales bacterium]|nr:T9SS type A sorting domain-containing protein [Flavobacteriales bacterium]
MDTVMRTMLTGVFWAMVVVASAQSWCHPGSEWRYTFYTSLPELQPEATLRVQYLDDVIFQGESCQRLKSTTFATDTSGVAQNLGGPTYYTTSSSDLIRFWNNYENIFDTLVYFGGGPGTTWHYSFFDPKTIVVVDTGSRVINGLQVRYVIVDPGDSFLGQSPDTIYERIGALQLFNPFPLMTYFVDASNEPLQCYKDDEFEYITTWGSEQSCSIALVIEGSANRGPEEVNVFPNPGGGQVTVTGCDGSRSMRAELCDAQGRIVITKQIFTDRSTLNTLDLLPGMYLVRVIDQRGTITTLRWLKEP